MSVPAIAQVQTQPQTQAGEGAEKFLGSVVKDVYTNEFFHFRLTKAPTMIVLNEEQKAAALAAGNEFLGSDAKIGRDAWAKAANAEVLLFSLTDKDPSLGPGPSLNIGALRQRDGVTPTGVCNVTRDFLTQNPKVTVQTDTRSTKLAGKDGALIDFALATSGETVFIRYYALIVKGHSLTFVMSYIKKEDLDRFEKILRTLEFSA